MARFLTLLMILTLVVANGTAVAGAVCRHRDSREHAIARQSQDAKVMAAALTEEAAAALASKKGALGSVASLSLPAYVLPAAAPYPLPHAIEPMLGPKLESAPLPSRSIRPLLEPPVA
jgi:predicted lysophospholipase L1 biosynthesis ABC-type transport system permease subunit